MKEEFRWERWEYKRMSRRKIEKERGKYIRETRKASTEQDVWSIIRKEKKRRIEINENIEINEWKNHIMKIFNGSCTGKGRKDKCGANRQGVEEISLEEAIEAIKSLKKGKAARVNGIPNKAWIYGGCKIVKTVWSGEGWPEC